MSKREEEIFSNYRDGHKKIIIDFWGFHSRLIARHFATEGILCVTRLKRRETIKSKIAEREKEMALNRMHDIAGLRLLFPNLKCLHEYRECVSKEMLHRYELVNKDERYNYIKNPRETGYRGIHDVYREKAKAGEHALQIEVQYRTLAQHSWATTLEIWDSFYGRKAKFGDESKEFYDFFSNVSELFARIFDKDTSRVLTLSNLDLYRFLKSKDHDFGFISRLRQIPKVKVVNSKINRKNKSKKRYILLCKEVSEMNPEEGTLTVRKGTWERLSKRYFILEHRDGKDWLLINFNGPGWKRVYNNYLNDCETFLDNYEEALKSLREHLNIWDRVTMLLWDCRKNT